VPEPTADGVQQIGLGGRSACCSATLFDKAEAWDAPLMMAWPSQLGSMPIFGTEENFAQYQISALLQKRAEDLV
jgi:hypothetical protein